jgi:pyridoxamine 5'-phosphate oxidase
MNEAKSTASIREPTAMSVATVSKDGSLSNRIVLLKQISPAGLYFFTNYNSHKGKDLADHAAAAVVFYWDPLEKQVRVTGPVKKSTREESESYWATRSRASQLSQYISTQSEPAESRDQLEKLVLDAEEKFNNQPIPCPAHWGGYILEPLEFEFWHGRPGRLHDRFQFLRTKAQDAHWTTRRLYP